ncbi:MAG: hypothetical protein KY476_18660, partial [Planctomycetes bacterium]|nr:hypothetical protein [Planctomycetota bacterium]
LANLRLKQMRDAARRFSAEIDDTRTDKSGVRRPLRMLTAPLYRYDSPADPIIDGAIFGFVLGSDPEACLVLEARQEEGGPAWHYLWARMNGSEMTARLDGVECHRFERLPREVLWDARRPFCLVALRDYVTLEDMDAVDAP